MGYALFGWGERTSACDRPRTYGTDSAPRRRYFRRYGFPFGIANQFFTSELALCDNRTCASARHAPTSSVGFRRRPIGERVGEHTPTPYLLTAAVRVLYIRDGGAEFSLAWVRLPTYTPQLHYIRRRPYSRLNSDLWYFVTDLRGFLQRNLRYCGSGGAGPVADGRPLAGSVYLRRRSRPMVVGAITFARRFGVLHEKDCPAHHGSAHKTSVARGSREQCPHVQKRLRTRPLTFSF